MAKYKVCYTGFAIVEAESKEEAAKIVSDGGLFYDETSVDLVVEVDE